MACSSCSGDPQVPLVREGLPTVWAFGPFPDHEVVDYAALEAYGNLLEQQAKS